MLGFYLYAGAGEAGPASFWRVPQTLRVEPVGWYGRPRAAVLVNASLRRDGRCLGAPAEIDGTWPAIVDPSTGVLSLIADPFGCTGANVRAVAVQAGSAQVNTPGDCLNVRAGPDPTGEVLECLGDGTVVELVPPPPGTVSWTGVLTAWGSEGYVAREFLTDIR